MGELFGEHPGVGERVHGVAAVADDERGRLEGAALVAVRGDAPEEQALQDGRPRSGLLADGVERDVAVVGQQATRDRARESRDLLHDGLPERQRDQDRSEGERAREQGVVEHGHLDDHPAQALRCGGGDLQGGVGPERGAHDDGLLELEVIHQRDDLVGEEAHRVAPHVARALGFAVAEEVDGDDAVAERGEVARERAVHLLGEQQPVDQDQRPRGGGRRTRGAPAAAFFAMAVGPPPYSV